MNDSFLKYASNPKSFIVKKWLTELLKEKYIERHGLISERISSSLLTESDVQEFGNLLATIYEAGYFKAINEYRQQLEKIGVKVQIGKSS